MPEQQPARTVEQAYLMPNEDQRGFSTGLDMKVGFDEASSYINEALRDLMQYGRMSLENIAEGGKYRFGSGTESAPAIAFSADTDNGFYYVGANNLGLSLGGTKRWDFSSSRTQTTLQLQGADGSEAAPEYSFTSDSDNGLYYIGANNIGISVGGTKRWDFQTTKTVTTLNLEPSASDLDLGSSSARWDLFGQDVDIDTSLTLSYVTASRVLYAGTGGLISHDADLTFDGTALYALQIGVNVATPTPRLHVRESEVVGTTYSAVDVVTAERNGNCNVNIIAGAANSSQILFSDTTRAKAFLQYNHATDGVLFNNGSDRFSIASTGAATINQWLNIGTATDAGGEGDFACGLTGAHRRFFDQSVYTDYFYQTSSDANGPIYQFVKSRAGAACSAGDNCGQLDYYFFNTTPAGVLGARMLMTATVVTAGSEQAVMQWGAVIAGTFTEHLRFGGGGGFVVNENQADIDSRFEGDSISHMLFLDATATTENIAMLAAAAPNWQSMDRGLFIGDASAVPTGNPSSGGFLYSESGVLKWRGSSGTVTEIAPA